MKLVKLANFKPVKKPMKKGTWPTLPTLLVIAVPLLDAGARDRSDSIEVLANPLIFGIEKDIHSESS